jgi:hypothetical protein
MNAARAVVIAMLVTFAGGSVAAAQELEPGAYDVAPVGVNVVTAAYTFSHGDIGFDPALPLDDTLARINTLALSYARSINLGGRSGQISIAVPMVVGNVQARYRGDLYRVDRTGLSDPRVRVAINLFGAPAMDLQTFVRNRPTTTVGTSLSIVVPVGQYDVNQLINLGTNRWAFKPELAVSHRIARWTLELYGGVWLFTANTDFFRGARREQQPIGEAQFHVVYTFRPGLAATFNSNFYAGGRTTIDGRQNFDFQQNSRVGGTMKMPLGDHHGLRVAVSWGAYTTIGAAFTSVSMAYLYRWGPSS